MNLMQAISKRSVVPSRHSLQALRPAILIGAMNTNLDRAGKKTYLYGEVFSWSAAEVRELRESTTLVAEFSAFDGDESYMVFALTR